ncbi:hypothetical protein LIER_03285 [Lithospermum erythrorhizon]|uniref:MLO-like protein n=1 Tax=Lithospermum erythrorhizon TaxID=34254 RepID=A0AAV3NWH4_LITER
MAGGGASAITRQLDQTATWVVSLVFSVIIIISILLEKVLHVFGETFEKKNKKALWEALQKIKGELMVLGFISLLLTFGQNYITQVCIPTKVANTMLPCPSRKLSNYKDTKEDDHHRRLLYYEHRSLAADSPPKECKGGYVPVISVDGLHQLHIFIFFLAIFHVIFSVITMTLGRLKTRGWKVWEREIQNQQQSANDPSSFRLTHETSFVKDHSNFWTKTPILFYLVCFYRQFFRSVSKADYMSMRHGFVSVHLAPGSKFDFQKYMKRSLEDDFKIIVGISPLLWASAVFYLLLEAAGELVTFILSAVPLFMTLAVGTKLQSIITQMAVEVQERHAVVVGIPLVQVSDRHFWFSRPRMVLHLIHLMLFQNAFEITYFFWILYEFGTKSCFHKNFSISMLRVVFGVGVLFLCSYSTLPLYALVTQMGSTMKKSIFDEHTSKALMNWQKHAKKNKNNPQTKKLGGSPPGSPDNPPQPNQGPGETSIEMAPTIGKFR